MPEPSPTPDRPAGAAAEPGPPTGWPGIPGLTGLVVTAIGLLGIRRAGSRRTTDEDDR